MSAPDLTLFEDEARFQEAAVMFLRECLDAATKNNKKTTLFLSGGSTPGPIYQRLSEQKLKWSRIAIAQVDDRWVGLQDPGSNAALLKRTILKGAAKNARFVRMKSRHHKAVDGQAAVEAQYKKLAMKNSVAVLGMGMDGHVCSWFPGGQGLDVALDPANDNLVQAIIANKSKVTGPYLERISLTLSALTQCDSLLLLIKGADKRALLERAMSDCDDALPVSHLINAVGDRLTVMCAS